MGERSRITETIAEEATCCERKMCLPSELWHLYQARVCLRDFCPPKPVDAFQYQTVMSNRDDQSMRRVCPSNFFIPSLEFVQKRAPVGNAATGSSSDFRTCYFH